MSTDMVRLHLSAERRLEAVEIELRGRPVCAVALVRCGKLTKTVAEKPASTSFARSQVVAFPMQARR